MKAHTQYNDAWLANDRYAIAGKQSILTNLLWNHSQTLVRMYFQQDSSHIHCQTKHANGKKKLQKRDNNLNPIIISSQKKKIQQIRRAVIGI